MTADALIEYIHALDVIPERVSEGVYAQSKTQCKWLIVSGRAFPFIDIFSVLSISVQFTNRNGRGRIDVLRHSTVSGCVESVVVGMRVLNVWSNEQRNPFNSAI